MSMYDVFKTNSALEQKGVIVDYGTFRVTIARAGGTNKRYGKALEAKTRPLRRAIETETLSNERSMQILKEVFAETIVLNWEVKDEKTGTWKQGVEAPDGTILPFAYDAVLGVFNDLPDLFTDLQQQANKMSLFLEDAQASGSGN